MNKEVNYVSPIFYWGVDRSTRVQFEITNKLPPIDLISSCFAVPIHKGKIVLVKSPRGWGLPGGHREKEESPEGCLRREALEEAGIVLGKNVLVGQWIAKKEFESPHNKRYPETSYQLLYLADVARMLVFDPKYETSERKLVTVGKIKDLHHDYASVKSIFEYLRFSKII